MGGGTLWNRDVFCSQLLLLQSTSQIVMLGSHFDKGSGVIMCDLHTTGWRHSASASRPAASRGADSRESWVYERARKGCGVTWVYACESKNSGVALAWRGVAWICQMHFGTGGEREGVRKGRGCGKEHQFFLTRVRHTAMHILYSLYEPGITSPQTDALNVVAKVRHRRTTRTLTPQHTGHTMALGGRGVV